MSEFKEHSKAVERLLRTAQICGEDTTGNNLYDFLGIDKTATQEQIKTSIEENYQFYLSRRYVSGWKTLSKEFMASQQAMEYLLCEYRTEYDNYLLDLGIKELRNRFISLTRPDRELGAKEEKQLLQEGLKIGLSETQAGKMISQWLEDDGVKTLEASSTPDSSPGYTPHDALHAKTYYELFRIPNDADYSEIIKAYEREYNRYVHGQDKARWDRVSDGWEILKDRDKRAAYDQMLKRPEPKIEEGAPVLKVICKMDGYYLYKDVKKGAQFTETIIIKNDQRGQLQGQIVSDAEWLVPERANLNNNPEQTLGISVLTAKIPAGNYDAKGTITLDTNGGPPYLLSFRVILKDLEAAAASFRKTYLPLAAACAGFIGSFSRSPLLFFLVSAVFAGILFYSIAKLIVKAALENDLNILKLPSNLIHSLAAGVIVLTILSHSFGSSVTKRDFEHELPDMSSLPEKPYALATPQAEQLDALAEDEKSLVMMDRNQQFSQTDDIPAGTSTAFTDSLASMDSNAVGAHIFREFRLKSIDDDKARYGFGLKTQQNPFVLYFDSQDWDFVQKSPQNPRCNKSPCPLADEPNNFYKPRLANGLKNPGIHGGYVTAARVNARLASSAAKSKKWKPKTSSFAPPSRDDL
jgi:hypothetical protein